MRSFYLLFTALLFVTCQSKPSGETVASDSLNVESSTDTIQSTLNNSAPSAVREVKSTFDASGLPEFNALINSGADIYADSTFESEMVSTLETVTPAIINSVSTLRNMSEGDECQGYYWYNVTLPGNKIGWVEGTSVMLDNPEFHEATVINDKGYQMYQAMDASAGPSDESGLTGCEQFYIPYLFNEDDKTINFISLSDVSGVYFPDFISNYYGWLALTSSDVGTATISSLTSEDSELIMNLDIRYQEGGGTVIVKVSKVGDKFSVSSFENQEEVEQSTQ